MRLICLPCDPVSPGGYNRVASDDLRRLGSVQGDVVCVYLERGKAAAATSLIVHRPRRGGWRQLVNLCRLKPFSNIGVSQLARLVGALPVTDIFCGDVIFYDALRAMFPSKRMTVRFHNFFALAAARHWWRGGAVDSHFRMTLGLAARLERRICNDDLVFPIFINPRERDLFQLMYPQRECDVWGVETEPAAEVLLPTRPRLVYMGGTASHQVVGLKYLIATVLPPLRANHPSVELHLWGHGTQNFHAPHRGVFGYGFWAGEGLPLQGDGLFVIPDLFGGGIKVKTGDALSAGIAFITTPFGAEGYQFTPHPARMVCEMAEWRKTIEMFFYDNGILHGA